MTASDNVWVQVRRSPRLPWDNRFSVPRDKTAGFVEILIPRYGADNVRVDPTVRKRVTDECSCYVVVGDGPPTMALCPTHAREVERREVTLREELAASLEKQAADANNPILQNALASWAHRIRNGRTF
jgi:hypothetical protein